MKKLILLVLVALMLIEPLASPKCFADESKKLAACYVQNEKCSKNFKQKDLDLSKGKKTLSCLAVVTIALTSILAFTLKRFEDKLSENIKAKLPFLFFKKTQGIQESIENAKVLEAVMEYGDAGNENVKMAIEELNITKNKTVETSDSEDEIMLFLVTNDNITTSSAGLAIANVTTKNTDNTDNTNWFIYVECIIAALAVGTSFGAYNKDRDNIYITWNKS